MTLRLRLTVALVVLVTLGLGIFAVATLAAYRRSQYDRLDEQLRLSVPLVNAQLDAAAGLGGASPRTGPGSPSGGRPPGGSPVVLPPDVYGELTDADGTTLSYLQLSDATSQPDLPAPLPGGSSYFTVGSSDGSGDWRAYATSGDRPGTKVAVAVPLAEVSSALEQLILIEGLAAAGLVTILGVGSWLILRRGLHPLEQMATSARSIAAGDLSVRVEPADDRTEVGQLGLALNTMLGEIEESFAERDATEERLRQFLADASHELRTPLTSIQGFAELFRLDAGRDKVDLEVIMRRIEEESARMKLLVEDLLLLARLDQTRPAERAPVDLSVLAADACSDAIAASPTRPITLDAPAPVTVLGDADHLRQAVANLVTNALRHTPEGTAVEVVARQRDGTASVLVRDHGPGLDDEALAHVFDRFWQADRARVGSGAGLGLPIVAAIAAEHGGEVTAANAAGGGAEFAVRLPVGEDGPFPGTSQPASPQAGGASPTMAG